MCDKICSHKMNVFKINYLPWSYIPNWWHNFKQFFKNIRYAWQRATKGYCDFDKWDLRSFYATLIHNTLFDWSECICSYPIDFTVEGWQKRLQLIANNIYDGYYYENHDKLVEGFISLTEVYEDLWD